MNVAAPIWRLVGRRHGAIAAFNSAGASTPVYCVHPIFGDVTSFSPLARALGPAQRFYGIQVPKEKMHAAFAASVESLARHHVEAITTFQPEGPMILGGWSAGAVVALEMAQQLRALGREVALLVAFDGAPCNTGAGISRRNPLYALKLARNLPGWFRCQIRHDASAAALWRRIAGKIVLRSRLRAPAFRNAQTLDGRTIQKVVDRTGALGDDHGFVSAFYNALLAYVPRPYSGAVLVYEAKVKPFDHLPQVEAVWTKLAARCTVVVVPGNHEDLFEAPAVDMLATRLREELALPKELAR